MKITKTATCLQRNSACDYFSQVENYAPRQFLRSSKNGSRKTYGRGSGQRPAHHSLSEPSSSSSISQSPYLGRTLLAVLPPDRVHQLLKLRPPALSILPPGLRHAESRHNPPLVAAAPGRLPDQHRRGGARFAHLRHIPLGGRDGRLRHRPRHRQRLLLHRRPALFHPRGARRNAGADAPRSETMPYDRSAASSFSRATSSSSKASGSVA